MHSVDSEKQKKEFLKNIVNQKTKVEIELEIELEKWVSGELQSNFDTQHYEHIIELALEKLSEETLQGANGLYGNKGDVMDYAHYIANFEPDFIPSSFF